MLELLLLVALLILIAIVYKPLTRIVFGALDGHAAKVRAELDAAKRLREEAQSLLAEHQRRLAAGEDQRTRSSGRPRRRCSGRPNAIATSSRRRCNGGPRRRWNGSSARRRGRCRRCGPRRPPSRSGPPSGCSVSSTGAARGRAAG